MTRGERLFRNVGCITYSRYATHCTCVSLLGRLDGREDLLFGLRTDLQHPCLFDGISLPPSGDPVTERPGCKQYRSNRWL
jgi:hypothetical protein